MHGNYLAHAFDTNFDTPIKVCNIQSREGVCGGGVKQYSFQPQPKKYFLKNIFSFRWSIFFVFKPTVQYSPTVVSYIYRTGYPGTRVQLLVATRSATRLPVLPGLGYGYISTRVQYTAVSSKTYDDVIHHTRVLLRSHIRGGMSYYRGGRRWTSMLVWSPMPNYCTQRMHSLRWSATHPERPPRPNYCT